MEVDKEHLIMRNVTSEDAKNLLTFLYKVSDETQNLTFSSSDLSISVEDETRFLSKASKEQTFIIAEYKGIIIGTTQLIIPLRERVKRTASMAISVLQAYWGEGVSTRLIENILERAVILGIKKINLKVRSDNTRAIKFYEKYNFKREGETSRMFYIDTSWVSGTYYGLEL